MENLYTKTFTTMKKQNLLFSAAIMLMSAAALFTACSKNTSADATAPGTQNVSLYMSDGPGVYLSVKLDVQSVQVLVDTSSNTRKHDGCDWDNLGLQAHTPDSVFVWNTLTIKPGVYDLLQLRNGVDTLLSQSNIKAGSIRLIKLNLGTNNTVVTLDSVSHAIQIPAGAPSYILMKLMGNEWEHFASNSYRLWIDFDVARSIVVTNGVYYLMPIIKPFVVNQTGSIAGSVAPRDAWPEMISVISNNDTSYALPNRDGFFKIRGLKAGTYSVNFNGSNGYRDTTINNIVISNTSNMVLPSVTLHK